MNDLDRPNTAHQNSVTINAEPDHCHVTLRDADGHIRQLGNIEADIICLAISVYGGRLGEVARRLRISRSSLYRKLHEMELHDIVEASRGTKK